MKLTILGNNGPFPSPDRACSGYLLRSDSGNTSILIDCGTGVLGHLRKFIEVDQLDAVLLSHLHFDHMSDMLPLQYTQQFHPADRKLPVYAAQTPENVRALLESNPFTEVRSIADTVIGEMKISFLPVRHPVETYAIRVECDGMIFVYTGDTNTQENLKDFCLNADLLLADAGLSTTDYKESAPHLSAYLCGELGAQAQAKRLLLTHINPKYDTSVLLNEAVSAFPQTELAVYGASYTI